jgi:hypothetical protein
MPGDEAHGEARSSMILSHSLGVLDIVLGDGRRLLEHLAFTTRHL